MLGDRLGLTVEAVNSGGDNSQALIESISSVAAGELDSSIVGGSNHSAVEIDGRGQAPNGLVLTCEQAAVSIVNSVDATATASSSDLQGISNAVPLRAFRPFSRLPPELRLPFWRQMANHSQFVSFRCDHRSLSPSSIRPINSDAITLGINHESRNEVKKLFIPLLKYLPAPIEAAIRPDNQILYLDVCCDPHHNCARRTPMALLDHLHSDVWDQLEHLAVSVIRDDDAVQYINVAAFYPIIQFKNLRTLTVVLIEVPEGRSTVYTLFNTDFFVKYRVNGPLRMSMICEKLVIHFQALFNLLKDADETYRCPALKFKVVPPKPRISWRPERGCGPNWIEVEEERMRRG